MPIQTGWRQCGGCKALVRGPRSVCPPAGGFHAGGLTSYSLWLNEVPPNYQAGWFRCERCGVLFSGAQSDCADGGGFHLHAADASNYALRVLANGVWRRCGACKTLFSGANSRCPTGGFHVAATGAFALSG